RLRDAAREHPLAYSLARYAQAVREARDRREGRGLHALEAIEEMLRRIVGGVADERLGIDREPRRALGADDVPRVEIGEQHHRLLGRGRQFGEELEASLEERDVRQASDR